MKKRKSTWHRKFAQTQKNQKQNHANTHLQADYWWVKATYLNGFQLKIALNQRYAAKVTGII